MRLSTLILAPWPTFGGGKANISESHRTALLVEIRHWLILLSPVPLCCHMAHSVITWSTLLSPSPLCYHLVSSVIPLLTFLSHGSLCYHLFHSVVTRLTLLSPGPLCCHLPHSVIPLLTFLSPGSLCCQCTVAKVTSKAALLLSKKCFSFFHLLYLIYNEEGRAGKCSSMLRHLFLLYSPPEETCV